MQRLLALSLRDAYKITPEGGPVADVYPNPASLINTLLPNIFVFVGVVMVLYIFGAGLKIVMNPGDSKATDEGKKKISYAVLGLVMLLASYWIIQIIEFYTGVVILG